MEGQSVDLKRGENPPRDRSNAIHLLEKVAVAANEAPDIEQAMRACIDTVCALSPWHSGRAYLVVGDDSKELIPMKLRNTAEGERCETFRQVSKMAQNVQGTGLPDRVLASGKAAWTADLTKDPNIRRTNLAEDIGVRAALAFPVMVGAEVGAVLEFFSAEALEPDFQSLEIVTHVGTQLGRVIERERASEELKRAHEGLENQVAARTAELRSANDQLVREINQRQHAEEILSAKSSLLETTFESMNQGIRVLDAELKVAAFNQKYVELLGLPPGFIRLGMSYEEIARFRADLGDLGTVNVEKFIRKRVLKRRQRKIRLTESMPPNGLTVLCHFEPQPDGGYVSTYTDITERKRAEEEVAKKSALLETTFESMSEGISVYDADFKLRAFNQKFVELFDFPPDCISLGLPFEEVVRFRRDLGEFGGAKVEDIIRQRVKILQQGKPWSYERSLPGGTVLALRVSPMPDGGFLSTFTDITEQKRVEEDLRASQERIRKVMDNVVDGIFVIDELGDIRDINPASESMFGYRREEMLGRNVSMLMAETDAKRHQSFIEAYLRTGKGKIIGIGSREVTGRHKDGMPFPIDLAIGEICIGEKRRFVGIVRDITDRKQAEAEKADMETQIRHFQKLEAIGTLTGGIAHEFNNLLHPMLTLTELAMDDIPPKHPARDNLEKVLTAGSRAKILVQQISAYSRDEEPTQGPVELQTLVEETLGLLRTTLPATVEIRVDLDANGAKVCADPSQIHQILMNLSSNAADALDGEVGILEFRLHRCVAKTATGGRQPHLKLVIQDNGSGMDKKTVEQIFDPFYTTKEVGSGTGMGLAIVYSIVAGFGGTIKVKSEPGQGTAFEILLPLWTESDEADSAKPDAVGPRGNAETMTVQG